ncbi:MAG: AraC-like DNA-binding protein [Planctomycetota bacterium]|jgi:AraC-like DNA-binding protein
MTTRITRQRDSIHLFLKFLVHHIESGGVSEAALRQELQLKEGWLESLGQDDLLELTPRFLQTAQRLLDDDLLCLHAGERFHFCLAGAGGLAATHAPTPAMALETFSRFVSTEGIRVTSSASEEQTIFTVAVVAPWPRATKEQIVDGVFSGLVAALAAVCGSPCAPQEVRFNRAAPQSKESFARALRGPLLFGCPYDEIVMETRELSKASLLYEPMLYEQLRFIADLSTDQPAGTSPLRQLVEQAIRSGGHAVESVADTLQMTRRTLQRRLQKEGVTFRTVLHEVRVGMAKELLTESKLSVTEIAQRLHYSDDKAFRKAVKAITGKTPTELRGERAQLLD